MNEKNIYLKEKVKPITSELMYKELNENEIVDILSKYFYNVEESQKDFYKIFLRGLRFSFDSENPIHTAGIFYKNSVKLSPNVNYAFSSRLAKMFKNMIMGKSSTGIRIENYTDFCDITEKFVENFEIKPPSHNSILKAIIEDEKFLRRIVEDFSYYKKIEDIFSQSDYSCLGDLDNELMLRLEDELSKLEINKIFIVNEERIECVNLRIQQIEKKIEYITQKWA
ncbi:hypothetical protein [Methanosarcina spelaei]|nr:hypothetical protein [Methanosarcina spelaei]